MENVAEIWVESSGETDAGGVLLFAYRHGGTLLDSHGLEWASPPAARKRIASFDLAGEA
jgi:hypothetical protein